MTKAGMDQEYSKYINSVTKRCFDIAVCLFLFLLAVPAMALIGLAILVCDGRPILFTHCRVGKNGKLFLMTKFRTLCTDANPYAPDPETKNDPRVTMTGKFLRRYRLDELPQLLAVITGQMTFVGPRPDLPHLVATYEHIHRKRLLSKPGVTGLWQIFGNREMPIHKDIKYDLYYIRKANALLDIKIVLMTVVFIITPKLLKHLCQVKYCYENSVYTHNISTQK